MRTAIARGLAGTLVLLLAGAGVLAQEPAHEHQEAGKPAADAKPAAGMMGACKAMMAERDKMMGEMKAADERLDELVAKMRAASGEAKVQATSDVVSAMVEQRKAMRERMTAMQEKMMAHMMEHVQAGPGGMKMCPMMKMGGMKMGGMQQ